MAETGNDITSIHCGEKTLNRWSAVQSQCRPDLGDRGINEKMRRCHTEQQAPGWPPATSSGLDACAAPGPHLEQQHNCPECALTFHYTLAITMHADWISPSHCGTPLPSPSTRLWELSTPISSSTRPMLVKPQRVNHLSLHGCQFSLIRMTSCPFCQ